MMVTMIASRVSPSYLCERQMQAALITCRDLMQQKVALAIRLQPPQWRWAYWRTPNLALSTSPPRVRSRSNVLANMPPKTSLHPHLPRQNHELNGATDFATITDTVKQDAGRPAWADMRQGQEEAKHGERGRGPK